MAVMPHRKAAPNPRNTHPNAAKAIPPWGKRQKSVPKAIPLRGNGLSYVANATPPLWKRLGKVPEPISPRGNHLSRVLKVIPPRGNGLTHVSKHLPPRGNAKRTGRWPFPHFEVLNPSAAIGLEKPNECPTQRHEATKCV